MMGGSSFHSQAVQAFVRQAMTYIDHTPDKETRVELIKTLQSVTEGKVRPVHAGAPSMVCLFCMAARIHAIALLRLNSVGKVSGASCSAAQA